MQLRIELTGHKNCIVVSSLPRAFLGKVFQHCLGKNNTPYFANNCFKGVLYFDNELARKYAEGVGYAWTTWREEDRFYHETAFCCDNALEIAALTDGEKAMDLPLTTLAQEVKHIQLDALLKRITPEDAVIFMGSIDKATDAYVLDIDGPFDPDLLSLDMQDCEDFFFDDLLLMGVSYDGEPMVLEPGETRGMRMITPVLFSHEGKELDLYDFSG